ncbi:PAS domain S-box protein [Halovivax sp.]|uniref:PAS domain S-box protein n=1 Tax=Halovivax sp. TaxID=1935978 RepID=UPI0025BAE099|nr:PAS domain S-box protein [Halovivax sp.]
MSERADASDAAFWGEDADGPAAIQRYRTLVNTVDDGIYQLDAAGRFVAVNDVVVELTGYAREELLGEHVSILLADEDVDRIGGEIAESVANDEPLPETFELAARTVDGSELHCELRVSLLLEDGAFRGTVGTVRDVTERKRREERLDERERRLERERDLIDRILETSPVGIQVLDADGEVTRMNNRLREILEIPADEAGTYDPSQRTVYDEDGREIAADDHPFARTLETGEPVYDEVVRIDLPSGDSRWVSVNAAPLFDEDGDLDRVVTAGEDVTQLKARERRLESELDEVLGRVSDAFYALDEEWRYTHVNDRAAEFMGRSRAEILGENAWDLFPEAVGSNLYDRFHEAMETQEPVSFERYSEPFGIWTEVNAYPSETGLSVYFRDITERKERERCLEEAKTQLEAATEAGAVGTWEWHVPDDRMVTGETYARKFGVDPDAAREGVPSERFLAAICEDDRDRVEAKIEDALAAGGEYEVEYRIRSEDDELRWVISRGRVERDDDGTPLRFAGATTDITDRKCAELRLERHTEQLETLFELLPVGVVVADADGGLLEANEAAEKIWGGDVFDAASLDEYDKFPVRLADTGEPVSREEWTIARALRGEEITEPRLFEIDNLNGETRILSVRGMPVRDERDEVTRAVITLSDITERRRYQRRLEETVERLGASNERLEHFAYAASHDLQEPLRMVSSYLQLIEERYGDALDEDGEEFLAYAVDGADRMRAMIDGLLAYSRIEARGDPFEPTDLGGVVDDVLADLRLRIAESDADVAVGDLPRVEGDEHQLRQLFQNLLANAIEYSGDEPPTIRVDAEPRDGEWLVSVRDEGIGIDRDEQDRVFEVFGRLHSRAERGGPGIGLAICQRIVERHGGEIRVDSEPGEGSTFAFTLPAASEREN